MKMVSLKSMEEYESLPMTSWNIKQHPLDLNQDDALDTGIIQLHEILLILFASFNYMYGNLF